MKNTRLYGSGNLDNSDLTVGALVILTSALLLMLTAFPGIFQSNFYAGRPSQYTHYLSNTRLFVIPEAYVKFALELTTAISSITLIAGVGICLSKKWGFLLAFAPASIFLILSLDSLRSAFYGLFYLGAFLVYSVRRLSGKIGPPL